VDLPTLIRPNCNTDHKWLQMEEELCRRYNSHDTYVTAKLQPVLEAELARTGQLPFWHTWKAIIPVAIRMQRRGFGQVDWDELDRVEHEICTELDEVEVKLIAACPLFEQLEREAEEWKAEHEALDRAQALEKNAKRRKPLPESEVQLTRATQREKGYQSRLRKARERRESFFNQTNDLRGFLFDHLGFKPAPPSKRENRPARSLNDSALRYIYEHLRQKDQPNKWVLEDLSHITRLRTVLKMFLNPLRRQPDYLRNGRLYPTFKLYGAETLRWSVSDPGMHSWPPKMRPILRASEGHLFIAADYSQIEAGIAAIEADEQEELREWLDPEGDLHRLMACDALDLSRAEWEGMEPDRRTAVRQLFKTARYERLYGGEGTKARGKEGCFCPRCRQEEEGVKDQYRLGTREMAAALARWSRAHPKMGQWRNRHIASIQANNNSWLSPFGYRMISCKPLDDKSQREWVNKTKQHSVAMIINRALIDLDREGCPLVFQHHDSIIAEVREEEAEHWQSRMKAVMTQPIPELKGVSFPVDVKVGRTWGELK